MISYDENKLFENIKRLMKQFSITQDKLGERLGLSQNQVSDRLTGKTKITISELVEISSSFGVSVEELLGISESNNISLSTYMRYIFSLEAAAPLKLYNLKHDAVYKATEDALVIHIDNPYVQQCLSDWAASMSLSNNRLERIVKDDILQRNMGRFANNEFEDMDIIDVKVMRKAIKKVVNDSNPLGILRDPDELDDILIPITE